MLIRVFELDKKEELIVEFEATSVPAIGDVVSIGEDEEVRIVSKATWGVDRVVGTDLTLANLIMVDVYAVPTQYDATPDVEAVEQLRKELADDSDAPAGEPDDEKPCAACGAVASRMLTDDFCQACRCDELAALLAVCQDELTEAEAEVERLRVRASRASELLLGIREGDLPLKMLSEVQGILTDLADKEREP